MRFVFTSITFLIAATFTSCNQDNCETATSNANCGCYELYAPVCGCDGVTYANDCYAECAGITDYTEGACN